MVSDGVKTRPESPAPTVNGNGESLTNGLVHQPPPVDVDPVETREWLDSLDSVLQNSGEEARPLLVDAVEIQGQSKRRPYSIYRKYTLHQYNSTEPEPLFPGNRDMERRIKSFVRWNAMAMVVRANASDGTLGGHISTFASSATLYEIGFNHFFRGPDHPGGGDQIYFQGHASPGIYARAFLEGRLAP